MKKKLFTLFTLLLCLVSNGAWAAQTTIFNASDASWTSLTNAQKDAVISGGIISGDGLINVSFSNPGTDFQRDTDGIKMRGGSGRNATITINGSIVAKISEVVLTYSGTKRIIVSDPSVSRTDDDTNKTMTWSFADVANLTLSQNVGNTVITKIEVTYISTDIAVTTALWDFQNGNPATLAEDATGIEGKEQDVASSVSSIKMHVNANKGAAYEDVQGKLNYRSANGDAQCNKGTVIQVPVKGTKDVVAIVPKSGGYTIAGGSEVTAKTIYTATADDVAQGYVEIICSTSGYLYSISVSQYSVDLAPAKEYTSLCSTQALDFTGITALEAYYISATNATSATLSRIYQVPAGEGLIIKKVSDGTINVPVIASASAITNKLTGVTTATTLADGDYILSSGKFVQVDLTGDAASQKLAAYKAYIASGDVAGAREINIVFDDETTALTLVNSEKRIVNSEFFDLQGRRVAQPTKGLYIVNGKKVIVK